MKKVINVLAIFIIAVVVTSCQKEEINGNQSESVVNLERKIDPQFPLNEQPTHLYENDICSSIIENSCDYDYLFHIGVDLKDGLVINFEDTNKFVVYFPFITSNYEQSYYAISIYNKEMVTSKIIHLSQSQNYISGELFSGIIKITDTNNDLLVFGEIENGKWVSHGGHSSWYDCFETNSSTYWAIIGYVFCPVPTLIGISIGCL